MAIDRFADTVVGVETPQTEVRLVHRDGTVIWFDVESAGIFDPILGGYTVTLRNVSIQRASLDHAERSAAFEHIVSGFSGWALEVTSDETLDGLRDHLECLGRALACDSAFVLLLDDDRLRNVAGWADHGGSGAPARGPAP